MRAYLELIRFPAVFTAPADVICGIALAGTLGASLESISALTLVLASVCMYCAGMAANDIFDRAIDLEERPERPIPSGRIKLSHAWTLVVLLQMSALGLAYTISWEATLWTAGTILATYLYNAGFKSTFAGPLFMGLCRYGNGGLGLAILPFAEIPGWAYLVFVPVAMYVVALTSVSGYEVGGESKPGRTYAIWATFLAALGSIAVYIFGEVTVPWFVALLALVPPLWLLPAGRAALATASDGTTRGFVIRSIHGIVVMNAVVCGLLGQFLFAAALVALVIPARLVGRWFYAT